LKLSRRSGTFIQRWRVPLGFLSAAVFIFFARPTVWTLIIGGAIAIIGLGLRGWASGHIRKNAALAVSGPYAYTRNPLYLGSFLLGLGFTVAAANVWLVALFAALFLGIYLPVMKLEAKEVETLFGKDYDEYAQHVSLFIPRLTAWRTGEQNVFDFALYLKYREYRAALGLCAAWILLFLKTTFF
jgi:protein-S-isoprenylcysteine O-methyltransferase Ste14